MSDRLAGLRMDEKAACLVAERVLGVTAQAWDIAGRQGEVDAMLTYTDGRTGAFEVVSLAADGARHLDALLQRSNFEWPTPGEWWWTVQVGSVQDLPRLRKCYARVIHLCEAAGVQRPEELWHRTWPVDPDIRWLVEKATSDLWGHPDVPAMTPDRVRNVMVVPDGRGGGVDHSLLRLRQELDDLFEEEPLAKHLHKVARADADERHLFVVLHRTALSFPLLDGLMLGEVLPPQPPPLPVTVSHLWLAPPYSTRVLLWTPEGWEQHQPYD